MERDRRTIYEHIPRCAWQRGGHAVHIFCEFHLASQAGCVCETEGHVEHVVFVVLSPKVQMNNNIAVHRQTS